jgi:hypothetical protein
MPAVNSRLRESGQRTAIGRGDSGGGDRSHACRGGRMRERRGGLSRRPAACRGPICPGRRVLHVAQRLRRPGDGRIRLRGPRCAIGGPFTPGWKVLAGASIVAEIGLLTFRRSLARVIERATVRWTVWAGRHPELKSIEGTVAAGRTLESEMSGRRAVLVRTRRKDPSNSLVSDGLQGIDFTIVDDDGRHHAVSPSPHLYFDEPPSEPNDGGGTTETLLCPGDRVHVWGTAVSEPSASGARPDPRSPPLRSAIVGSERSPLVIRFARPPTAGRPARLAAKEQQLLPR